LVETQHAASARGKPELFIDFEKELEIISIHAPFATGFIHQESDTLQDCHPERCFCAKDLPRFFNMKCTVLALSRVMVEEPGKCN
jgi:hypothetical protein